MARYRRKPTVVEAEQFFHDVQPWPEGVKHDPRHGYVVETVGGLKVLKYGDFVVIRKSGRYVIPCETFKENYEEVK